MTLLRERGAQSVADAWNACAPAKYRLDADLVAQNLLDHPLFHEAASLWSDGAFVAVKRSAASLYTGPDPKVAHLSLLGQTDGYRSLEYLVHAAVAILRDEGYEALVVGQDSGHFLPGAPTDIRWPGWSLKQLGFERGGLAFDLEGNAQDVEPPIEGYSPEIDLRTLTEADVDSLLGFLGREFPGRWRYDVGVKVEAEGPSTVFGLMIEGEVQGFALLQEDNCRMPIAGTVWRSDLGPRWGSLGPIGVSREIRGKSYGIELLNAALVEIRRRGTKRTIIDWTSLVDFYGTQGFSVNRAYRAYRLSLQAGP